MKKRFSLRKRIIGCFSKLKKWNQSIVGWCKDKLSRIRPIRIPWKGLFNGFVQIGTIVATVIALFALRETRLQRESTYKPVVFIQNSQFYAKRGEMHNYEYYVERDDSLVSINVEPYYRLVNVGMGCAFNVVTEMHLNTKSLVSFLKDYGINDIQTIKSGFYTDLVVNKQDTVSCLGGEGLLNDMVSYVLPVHQSTESAVQNFIPGVNETILDVVRLVQKKMGTREAYTISFPVDVYYKDLNGKLYSYLYVMDLTYFQIKDDLYKCNVSSRLTTSDYLLNSYNPSRKQRKDMEFPFSF